MFVRIVSALSLAVQMDELKRPPAGAAKSSPNPDAVPVSGAAPAGPVPRESAPPQPMTLKVHIRDLDDCEIRVGLGNQTIKWLAFAAVSRYAAHHSLPAESFVPVHVHAAHNRALFPSEVINDCVKDGDDVWVETIGPKLSLNDPSVVREKTLWELYAYTPQHRWVRIMIILDANPYRIRGWRGEPAVTGNFNAWGVPIAMTEIRDDVWQLTIDFPSHSDILFKFVLDRHAFTSDKYRVVHDTNDVQMNFFHVSAPTPNYHELRNPLQAPRDVAISDPFPPGFGGVPDSARDRDAHGGDLDAKLSVKHAAQRKDDDKDGLFSSRVTGKFAGVQQLTTEMKAKMFDSDWRAIQIQDIVKTPEKRVAVRDAFWPLYDALRLVFRYYSSQSGRDIAYMNVLKFFNFCHLCKIVDKRVTVSRLDLIFHRVNIEEEYDEKLVAANGTIRKAMVIRDDPMNPNNQFIRSEFMEALVRIAVLKYNKAMEPADALKRLYEEHVSRAVEALKDVTELRSRLLEEPVQNVFAVYRDRLYRAFKRFAAADKTDLSAPSKGHVTRKQTINLKEFELLMKEYRLIDKDMSRQKALSAFAMSQEDVAPVGAGQSSSAAAAAGGAGGAGSASDGSGAGGAAGSGGGAAMNLADAKDAYEMVYPEFLECFARIAESKFHDQPQQPLSEKLLRLMQWMFPNKEAKKLRDLEDLRALELAEEQRRKEDAERKAEEKRRRAKRLAEKRKPKPTPAQLEEMEKQREAELKAQRYKEKMSARAAARLTPGGVASLNSQRSAAATPKAGSSTGASPRPGSGAGSGTGATPRAAGSATPSAAKPAAAAAASSSGTPKRPGSGASAGGAVTGRSVQFADGKGTPKGSGSGTPKGTAKTTAAKPAVKGAAEAKAAAAKKAS